MLPASHRMRRSAEFAAAVRRGRRVGRKTLVVHQVRYDGPEDGCSGPTRVGFVVNKSVGNAVTRNQVRRRLRHLMRGQLTALGPGRLVVVRALPAAAGASSAELGADVSDALAKLGRRPDVMLSMEAP